VTLKPAADIEGRIPGKAAPSVIVIKLLAWHWDPKAGTRSDADAGAERRRSSNCSLGRQNSKAAGYLAWVRLSAIFRAVSSPAGVLNAICAWQTGLPATATYQLAPASGLRPA